MSIVQDSPRRAYINVMELLVAEEVEHQLKDLSPRVIKYLKVVEVETYALNRLPALYASSEKGWRHQYEKAKRELRNQIKSAVRQAIAAVQVDPIRSSEPLQIGQEDESSGVLDSLRDLLKQPDLGWDGVVSRLRDVISTKNRSGGSPQPSKTDLESSHRTRYRPMPGDRNYASPPPTGYTAPTASDDNAGGQGQHWRPGTYGSSISWKRRQNQGATQSQNQGQNDPNSGGIDFDWNDSLYNK